jgi:hypothetical protein
VRPAHLPSLSACAGLTPVLVSGDALDAECKDLVDELRAFGWDGALCVFGT